MSKKICNFAVSYLLIRDNYGNNQVVLRRHFSEVWQIGLSYIVVYQRYTHLSRQVKEHPQFKSEVRGLSAKVPLHYSLLTNH